MLTVTERAQAELGHYKHDEGKVTVRFYIETEGGWSSVFEYNLVLDEPRPEDDVYVSGDVQVVVDRATALMLDEPLRIDYDEKEGVYRIRSNSQIIPDRIRL